MSLANMLRYNFAVIKVNYLIRGSLLIISLLLVLVLVVSSNWLPIMRLSNQYQSALDAGEKLAAASNLAFMAKYSSNTIELLEKAGLLAMEAGDNASAKIYLQQVREHQSLTSTGFDILGDIAFEEGNISDAIKLWNEAITIKESKDIYKKLVAAHRQSGNLLSAIQAQRNLVVLEPNNLENNYQLGLMLAVTEPETALAYLTIVGDSDLPVYASINSFVRDLRSALNRGDPAYPFMIAGQEMAAIGEWELALIAFKRATEINPAYADAWAYLGESIQQTGGDGKRELENALKIDPESTAGNTFLAIYWQRLERYDLALVYLYAATKDDEKNPALQVEIGNTLGLLGNIPAAEIHYQLATNMEPNDPIYWIALANYYIRYEIEIKDKAAAAARQAVLLAPRDPGSLDTLAQIYLLQENPLLAERFLNRALAADANYAPAHLHSGLVSILKGDRLDAFQHFHTAISNSNLGSPAYEQARRMLETYFP
jgi:tetratricopeptide (TPR) repeat protein